MAARKVIPFPHKFIPRKELDIIITKTVVRQLLMGDLIVKNDNPILKIDGLKKMQIQNSGVDTNAILIQDVIFDPDDNSMALRPNGNSNLLLDYEKIVKEIEKQIQIKK